jgi:hypothetical protein
VGERETLIIEVVCALCMEIDAEANIAVAARALRIALLGT